MGTSSKDHSSRTDATASRRGEVGRLLRTTREARGVDLRTVSDALRIRHTHLLAIEEGRYGDLPGATYAVGFVRAYAEHLGLDGAEVLRQFKDESALETQRELVFPTPVNEGGLPSAALIVVAVLLAGGVYGAWSLMSSSDRSVVEMIQDVPDRLTALVSGRDQGQDEGAEQDGESDSAEVESLPDVLMATEGNNRFLSDSEHAQAAGPSSPSPSSPSPSLVDQPADAAEEVVQTVDAAASEASQPSDAVSEDVYPPDVEETAEVAAPEPTPEIAPEPAPVAEAPQPTPELAPEPAPEPAPAPAPAPEQALPAAPPPAPALIADVAALPEVTRVLGEETADVRILLRATADSWVQVRDPQSLLVSRLMRRGEVFRVPDRPGLTLMTGNAGGLVIEVDGAVLPLLGRTGEVRRDIALEPDRLKAGAATPN